MQQTAIGASLSSGLLDSPVSLLSIPNYLPTNGSHPAFHLYPQLTDPAPPKQLEPAGHSPAYQLSLT